MKGIMFIGENETGLDMLKDGSITVWYPGRQPINIACRFIY